MKKKRRKTKKKSTVGGGEEELGGILSGAVEEDEDLVAVVGELDLGVGLDLQEAGDVLQCRHQSTLSQSLLHSGTKKVLCFFRSTMKELIFLSLSSERLTYFPSSGTTKIALLFSFHYEPTNFSLNFFFNFL